MEFEAPITQIRDYESGDVKVRLIKLDVPKGIDFKFETGQAVFLGHESVKHLKNPSRLKWAAFSVASSHLELKEGILEFCIRSKTKEGLTYFISNKMKVGDKLKVKGPLGVYRLHPDFDNYYFASIGSGIAPFIAMARTMLRENWNKKITFFFGIRNNELFLYKEELEKYAKENPNFQLIVTQSRPDENWTGPKGYVQKLIEDYDFDKDKGTKAFYVCGMQVAIDEISAIATKKGIPKDKIYIEKWG